MTCELATAPLLNSVQAACSPAAPLTEMRPQRRECVTAVPVGLLLAYPLLGRAVARWPGRECVFLNAFETGGEAKIGIECWIGYYNADRPHSVFGGRTPDEAYATQASEQKLAA